jgi:hypothetical protein
MFHCLRFRLSGSCRISQSLDHRDALFLDGAPQEVVLRDGDRCFEQERVLVLTADGSGEALNLFGWL